MEGKARGTNKTAMIRAIPADAWTTESAKIRTDAQDLATYAVDLSHHRDGCAVFMFPRASDEFWDHLSRRCRRMRWMQESRLKT